MEHQKSNNSNLHAAALCGLRKERQRELLLGRRRIGFDARLCRNDDDVRPVYHLCGCRRFCGHSRIPDIHQDEHGRRRNHQAYPHAGRSLPLHYRGIHRIPGILRLPNLENHECKTIIKVQLKRNKHV